jgi:hypothetical protein
MIVAKWQADPKKPDGTKEIDAMTDNEVLAELNGWQPIFGEVDRVRLEGELLLRAAVMGWTGDPLQQPPRAVLAAVRKVKSGGVK